MSASDLSINRRFVLKHAYQNTRKGGTVWFSDEFTFDVAYFIATGILKAEGNRVSITEEGKSEYVRMICD